MSGVMGAAGDGRGGNTQGGGAAQTHREDRGKEREGQGERQGSDLLLSVFVRVTLLIPSRGAAATFWIPLWPERFRCRRLLLSSVRCSAIGFLMRSLFRSIRQSRSRWESQVWIGHFQEEGSHAGG